MYRCWMMSWWIFDKLSETAYRFTRKDGHQRGQVSLYLRGLGMNTFLSAVGGYWVPFGYGSKNEALRNGIWGSLSTFFWMWWKKPRDGILSLRNTTVVCSQYCFSCCELIVVPRMPRFRASWCRVVTRAVAVGSKDQGWQKCCRSMAIVPDAKNFCEDQSITRWRWRHGNGRMELVFVYSPHFDGMENGILP